MRTPKSEVEENVTEIRCIHCGRAGVGDGQVMDHFLTWRIGTRADQIGAKFGYLCEPCGGPLCLDCLDLRGGYPCPPERVEYYPFACPRCKAPVSVVTLEQAGGWEAPRQFRHSLQRMASTSTPGCLVPYASYDAVLLVAPGHLVASHFGPRPVPLGPGDLWRSHITAEIPGEGTRTLVLHRWDHPTPRVDALLDQGGTLFSIGTLDPDHVYYDRDLWRLAGIPTPAEVHFSLSLGSTGFYLAQLSPQVGMHIHKIGVVQGSPPPAPRALMEIAVPPREDTPRQQQSRETVARLLTHLTDLSIWDYTWLEAPRPGTFGKRAILALAGSTDLMYYHLIRVVFKGVLYHNFPVYFHHPGFSLASAATTRQMQDLVPWGPRSKLICLQSDRGGSFERTQFMVADFVFLITDGMKENYRPSKQANEDWW